MARASKPAESAAPEPEKWIVAENDAGETYGFLAGTKLPDGFHEVKPAAPAPEEPAPEG